MDPDEDDKMRQIEQAALRQLLQVNEALRRGNDELRRQVAERERSFPPRYRLYDRVVNGFVFGTLRRAAAKAYALRNKLPR
jgi:hypothetical protein